MYWSVVYGCYNVGCSETRLVFLENPLFTSDILTRYGHPGVFSNPWSLQESRMGCIGPFVDLCSWSLGVVSVPEWKGIDVEGTNGKDSYLERKTILLKGN